jgi:predicted transcriptional regulator
MAMAAGDGPQIDTIEEGSARGLWDATSGAFLGANLRRSILARGWTVPDFARASRIDPGSVYAAIHGRRVRDTTAIRIFETLERRSPMTVVWE